MAQAGQNWDLFGYDVRQVLRHWRSAWREFLWGYESPLMARLDEELRVYSEDGEEYFHAGQRRVSTTAKSDGRPEVECEAVLLPDSLVLSKILVLPLAVESDIEMAMDLEVTANSPFPESDTGYGWKLSGRDEKNLQVQLAIVSLSSTMSYLGRQYDCHDAQAREVWAQVGNGMIVLSGFGEKKRLHRYNKRLLRVAITVAYTVALLLVISGTSAGMKYLELQQLRGLSNEVKSQARGAMEMRTAIVAANETITAMNELVLQRPNPHFEMVRLSQMLGDDVSLIQFSMVGTRLDIRGIADDAAVIVQQLTDEPAYASVTAPQAITKYFNTGQEQFFLNIELSAGKFAGGDGQ